MRVAEKRMETEEEWTAQGKMATEIVPLMEEERANNEGKKVEMVVGRD